MTGVATAFGAGACFGSGVASSTGFGARFGRMTSPRNWGSRGAGRWPSISTESRSIWATSRTTGRSGASVSALTPPVNMVLQKGQPVAISSAPVASACSERNSLTRRPMVSSMYMRAPPAPQQKASSRAGEISTSEAPAAETSSRGGS